MVGKETCMCHHTHLGELRRGIHIKNVVETNGALNQARGTGSGRHICVQLQLHVVVVYVGQDGRPIQKAGQNQSCLQRRIQDLHHQF